MNTVSNDHVELIYVVALIAGISAFAWLLMAKPLRLYKTASLRFMTANICIVLVVVSGLLRDAPDSIYTFFTVVLVVLALGIYDLAIRRLFRIDDSFGLLTFIVATMAVASVAWLNTWLSSFHILALLYILAAISLLRTALKKAKYLKTNTSLPASCLLTTPDYLVSLMLLVKATMLLASPSLMWSFMKTEGDNTLVIWLYILLTLTVNVTAFASALSRLILQMKYLATHDQLTGLYNRRAVTEILNKQWATYHRTGQPFCILMLDVDHFKQINDEYGHQTGDRALRYIADSLVRVTSSEQAVARFGGEEFIVVLPHMGMRQASVLATQICETVQMTPWDAEAGRITVSIGCGSAVMATTLDQLLSQADDALYHAKHAGRDQVKAFYASSS